MPKYSIILILLLLPVFVFAIPATHPNIIITADKTKVKAGESVKFDIIVKHVPDSFGGNTCGHGSTIDIIGIDFGDGNIDSTPCVPIDLWGCVCKMTVSHSYDTEETFTVFSEGCIRGESRPCTYQGGSIIINPQNPTITNCIPDGCNRICPLNCNVTEDPDCGCVPGNNCCGRGCSHIDDSDCPLPQSGANTYDNPILANNIVQFLWQVLYLFFTAIIYLSIIFILIGAYILVTSGGNPLKVDRGKKIVIFTLIGTAISLICRGILVLILNVLKS